MCSRVLYVGQDDLVVTGRSMDWMVPTGSNVWALPAGLTRDGAAAVNSFSWTSIHGSMVSTMYDGVTVDGLNDAGLGANALYLAAATYPERDAAVPGLSVAAWTQYALDMFSSVAEAVEGLTAPPFQIVSPVLPGGHAATGHLALSDATGDSAIFEYLDGDLVVHHGPDFAVMTNDPTYDQQLALCTYWDEVGGNAMLPGTERPADRFVRARYYLNGSTRSGEADRGVAEVFAIVRNVSVPMIRSTPDKPNVAPTLWRSAMDHRSLTYYWEATDQPNVFWVEIGNLDLTAGAPAKRLEAEGGPTRAGEVSGDFVEAEPFTYLPEVAWSLPEVAYRPEFTHLPEPEAERYVTIDQYDLGQATMGMLLAATDLGIGSGHSAVGDQEPCRRILGIPADHTCAYMIALGYPADRPLQPIVKPDRRPFDQVVHRGRW